MKRSTVFSLLAVVVLIPATLYLGTHLKGRWYYLTSTLVIVEAMLPFFLRFEARKPQARELVTIAVMCALAVAGRVVIPLPHFKAVTGIIMIAGIAFGAEAGFMTGAVAAFASNFFYSQGPWTPWQMLSYGTAGFLAGLLFHRKRLWFQQKAVLSLGILAVFGFAATVLIVGPLLDCCTIFTTGGKLTLKYAMAVFAIGFPTNVIHGFGSALTLVLLSRPLLGKLNRLQAKYGMLSE